MITDTTNYLNKVNKQQEEGERGTGVNAISKEYTLGNERQQTEDCCCVLYYQDMLIICLCGINLLGGHLPPHDSLVLYNWKQVRSKADGETEGGR